MRSRAIFLAGVLMVVGLLAGVTAGSVTAATSTTVTWKVTSLTAGQVKSLSAVAKTNSSGVKTWSKKGSCTLTPKSKPTTLTMGSTGSCTLTLKIAKSGKYPAKTTTTTITLASATTTTSTSTTVPTTPQWPATVGMSGKSVAAFPDGSSIVLGTTGSNVIVVAKYSALGTQDWIRETSVPSGTGNGQGTSIAVGSDSSAVITGSFNSKVGFGSTILQSTVGGNDVFVAKISSSGNWLWATKGGGEGTELPGELAVLSDGSAIITGGFQDSVLFGSTTLTSEGNSDAFVAKISSTGAWLWAAKAGGMASDVMTAQAVLSDGSIIVGGYHDSGTMSFGTISLSGSRWFLAKLSSSGVWVWAINVGLESMIASLTTVPGDDVLVTGGFSGTHQFGDTTLTAGGDSVFVAKVSSSGTWQWATKTVGSGHAYGIAGLSDGSAILTGDFARSVVFGGSRISELGNMDIFAAKISSSGNWLWASGFGTDSFDRGYGVATFSDGSAVLTGVSGGNFTGIVAKVSSDGVFVGR